MVFLLTLVARLSLGLSLAALLGFVVYLVGSLIMVSFGVPSAVVVDVSIIASWTVGAGIGGFLGWMEVRGEWRRNLVTFGLVLVGALVGAVVGLQIGIKEETSLRTALSLGRTPWLPSVLVGAMVGSNILPLLRIPYLYLRRRKLTT